MYHSIYLGEKNTWDDFHLVPSSRPVVALPEVRTVYVDVHGTDGTLDLTTAQTGGVQYKNREGSWEFTIANDTSFLGRNCPSWELLHHEIANYLHGKRMRVILEDDPFYYYMGRLSLSEWKSDQKWSTITIDYYLDPYKYEMFDSIDDWLWDPFNFESGVIREYASLRVDETFTLRVIASERPCIPEFDVESDSREGMTVVFDRRSYKLKDGINKISDICITTDTKLIFEGYGIVSVNYRGGWL